MTRLRHTNIVDVIDTGTLANDQPYVVMELVKGIPLDQFLHRQKCTVDQTIAIFLQVCDAILCAHQRGIIHRDLKPANVLVEQDGTAKVLDFGLAKILDKQTTISMGPELVGSVQYMAPEQVTGDSVEVDTRTDVYSLGVMLYQAVTGSFPYQVDGQVLTVLQQIVNQPPIPPRVVRRHSTTMDRSSRFPADLEVVLLKALAKEPWNRYATVGDFAADITAVVERRPVAARKPSLAYRLKVSLARHKLAVIGTLLIASLIGGGTTVALMRRSAARAERLRWCLETLRSLHVPAHADAGELNAAVAELKQRVERGDLTLSDLTIVADALIERRIDEPRIIALNHRRDVASRETPIRMVLGLRHPVPGLSVEATARLRCNDRELKPSAVPVTTDVRRFAVSAGVLSEGEYLLTGDLDITLKSSQAAGGAVVRLTLPAQRVWFLNHYPDGYPTEYPLPAGLLETWKARVQPVRAALESSPKGGNETLTLEFDLPATSSSLAYRLIIESERPLWRSERFLGIEAPASPFEKPRIAPASNFTLTQQDDHWRITTRIPLVNCLLWCDPNELVGKQLTITLASSLGAARSAALSDFRAGDVQFNIVAEDNRLPADRAALELAYKLLHHQTLPARAARALLEFPQSPARDRAAKLVRAYADPRNVAMQVWTVACQKDVPPAIAAKAVQLMESLPTTPTAGLDHDLLLAAALLRAEQAERAKQVLGACQVNPQQSRLRDALLGLTCAKLGDFTSVARIRSQLPESSGGPEQWAEPFVTELMNYPLPPAAASVPRN